MNWMPLVAAGGLMIMCGGCSASNGTDAHPSPPPMEAQCHAEGLDQFIGQKATAETGAAMLKASGARTLRWGGPGMAMTMDYRADRLTVSYDRDMIIERASCG